MRLIHRWAVFAGAAVTAFGALGCAGAGAASGAAAEAVDGRAANLMVVAPFDASPAVDAAVAAANADAPEGFRLVGAFGFNYILEGNDGPWYVDDALDAVLALHQYGTYAWQDRGSLIQEEFELDPNAPFTGVLPAVNGWLGQPGEPVQIGFARATVDDAPGAVTWKKLYVIVHYESMNVAVLEKDMSFR